MQSVATIEQLQKNEKLKVIVFYTEKSEKSLDVLNLFKEIEKDYSDIPIYSVNASDVKTIHPVYNIDSVPAVLAIKNNSDRKVIYGKQTKSYYEMIFQNNPRINSDGETISQPNVTVYSTPTCVYCNHLKSYLRKNRIMYSDINIATDSNAATELQQRTGQTGVPQTDIDGEIIVGFDRKRINEMLNIKGKGK